jgi:endonuclease III
MKELSIDQQELITKKWLSLADDFPPGFSLPYFVCDNHDDTRPNAAPSRPSSSASAAIATSLVDDFIEIRRFQVLVAARLHARCQESSVRKAMTRLRSYFQKSSRSSNINADDGVAHGVKTAGCRTETLNNTITINNIASADPVKLAHGCLSNLQFYNVKAESLVKAAQQIQKEHGGFVPVDEESLLKVTGVGKVFADLLAFVNTRENHLRFIHGALK